MKLKIKFLKWSAGLPVAMLNEKTAEKLGIHTKDRLSIKTLSKPQKETSTIVDTIKDLIGKREIAVSSELKSILEVKSGKKVLVSLCPAANSIMHIRKKLDGGVLNKKEIEEIIEDVTNNTLSEAEIALFISALHIQGMNSEETFHLTNSFLKTGKTFSLKNKYVVNKHCIGGIPGNKTTPIVVSICAAAGLIFPKTSSRAITSEAGTADVINTIAKVDFSIPEIKSILNETNACLIWGGGIGLIPADSKLIKVERVLMIDAEPLLLASVMSKKLAVGSKYILIDIPYGKNAKVSKEKALRLKKKFQILGKQFDVKVHCVLTNGSQPIGKGIGPIFGLNDILRILKNDVNSPADLRKKALFLSGQIFEMTGKSKPGQGIKLASEILDSGDAFRKFKQIIKKQKGSLDYKPEANFKEEVFSKKSGSIKEINNKKINSLARVAGCPVDIFAGMILHKKVGDKVKKGDKLITIYSESKSRLKHALEFYNCIKPITLR